MPAITRAMAADPPRPGPGQAKRRIFDSKVPGLLLETRRSGVSTWYIRLTVRGRQREIRLGRAGVVTLDQVRKRANELKAEAALGGDPAGDRDRLKAIPTFSEFVESAYLPYIKTKLRSYRDQESFYRLRLKSAWGSRRMDEIRPVDIVSFQERLSSEGLSNASINRQTAFIKRLYNLAIQWEVIACRNPAQRALMRPEQHRERFLTDNELVALFRALDVEPSRAAACAIALLAATGARRGEILGARWDRIDMERRILTVPADRSKSGRARHIPLSDAALRILEKVPRNGSEWVFSGKDPSKPISDLKKVWVRVKQAAGLETSWVLHQLRHTYASRLVAQGRSLYEVGQLLGHSGSGVATTARYAHLAPQRLVEAANLALPDRC